MLLTPWDWILPPPFFIFHYFFRDYYALPLRLRWADTPLLFIINIIISYFITPPTAYWYAELRRHLPWAIFIFWLRYCHEYAITPLLRHYAAPYLLLIIIVSFSLYLLRHYAAALLLHITLMFSPSHLLRLFIYYTPDIVFIIIYAINISLAITPITLIDFELITLPLILFCHYAIIIFVITLSPLSLIFSPCRYAFAAITPLYLRWLFWLIIFHYAFHYHWWWCRWYARHLLLADVDIIIVEDIFTTCWDILPLFCLYLLYY